MMKRKRNPQELRSEVKRKIAELLASAIENYGESKSSAKSFYLAVELYERNEGSLPQGLFCEDCMSANIEENCDYEVCYPWITEECEECEYERYNCRCDVRNDAEEFAEKLGIKDYVDVFRYKIQCKKYIKSGRDNREKPDINLRSLKLLNLDLSDLNLGLVDLTASDLSGSDLTFTILSYANLTNCNLTKSNLQSSDLYGAFLINTNLHESNLYESNLYKANLSEANLSEANLEKSDLSYVNLKGADLTNTNLKGADLHGADFTNTKITLTTDFTDVKNINSTTGLYLPNPRKISMNIKNKTKRKSRKILTKI